MEQQNQHQPELSKEEKKIMSEIENLTANGLVDYILKQKQIIRTMRDNDDDKFTRIRMAGRLPRKRAMMAAKLLYKDDEEMLKKELTAINKLIPTYISKKDEQRLGLADHYQDIVVMPRYETAFLDRVRLLSDTLTASR